ncbi:MAG: enoyl-CoA hydratase [Herbaspirillum sp.]|jgi:enoyl-CoA hydratase/carnithine racemase|nr:enoyl-CoA hydratase [Herbaspirillum sp.]
MSEAVLFEELPAVHGYRIGIATLNVEKTLNALSLEMTDSLTGRLTQWAADAGIAMVILQGAGEKAFCAGGDLQQLYRSMTAHHASAQRGDIRGNPYAAQFFEREYRLNYLIHTYPKPLLCWGHGIVMGGGLGLMAGASHRVVTERSRLAMPEITVGLYPDVGGSWFLNRMPGRLGLFLALTGASLNAADAKFVDLADYQIAHEARQQVIDTLLQQPWGSSDAAASVLLGRVLQQAEQAGAQQAGVVFVASQLRENLDAINALCSAQTLPEIVASLLKVKTDNVWLRKAVATLTTGAPGSAWLSYVMQRRARYLSLAQVFRLEFTVSLHCAARPDFAEGIRALLIDKDQKPNWQPATLADVTPQWVDGAFADPWGADRHPLADLEVAC